MLHALVGVGSTNVTNTNVQEEHLLFESQQLTVRPEVARVKDGFGTAIFTCAIINEGDVTLAAQAILA